MAIMEIKEEVMSSSGFSKGIDKGAYNMVMQHAQVSQYSKPHASAIRELVSNAVDAITGKLIARNIIQKGEPVSKYFIERDNDPSLEDSNFDPAYFDFKWLDKDNKVTITYEEGGDTDKDQIIIEDTGVGLGGKRLLGYFDIGFSTNRNNKVSLGKYGFGSKSALAVNPYYTMKTRYNGREYHFMVYVHDVQPLISKFNLETGEENPSEILITKEGKQIQIYYLNTERKNGTTIIMDSKKHHKQFYVDAVKKQLMYFDYIEFRVKPKGMPYNVVDVKAKIMYEDDTMILSDNDQFNKPHVLLNKVNYNTIDFKELELQEMTGNIGIKINPDNVEISPSREFVIWNDKTRAAVVEAFDLVVKKAGDLITEQLNQTDFFQWLITCANLTSYRFDNASVIARLSKIVDVSKSRPRFKGDPRIVYDYSIFGTLLNHRLVQFKFDTEKNVKVRKLDRNFVSLSMLPSYPIVIRDKDEDGIIRKTKYLLMNQFPNGFIEFRPSVEYYHDFIKADKIDILKQMGVSLPKKRGGEEYLHEITDEHWALIKEYAEAVMTALGESRKDGYHLMSEVVVPDDFKVSLSLQDEADVKAETKEEQQAAEEAFESMRERRKREGKTVLFTPRSVVAIQSPTANVWYKDANGTDVIMPAKDAPGYTLPKPIEMHKIEPKFKDIDLWAHTEEIFFGNKEHDSLICMAAMITRVADSKITNLEVPRPSGMRPYASNGNTYEGSYYNRNAVLNVMYRPDELYNLEPDVQNERASWFFQNPKIKLLQVAKENMKYYKDFKFITQFFMDIKGKTLTMSNALIRWNTARLIKKDLHKLAFLHNFSALNDEMAQRYSFVKLFVSTYHRDMESHKDKFFGNSVQEHDQLIGYLDKVFKFQEIVRESKSDPAAIGALAMQWFQPEKGVEIEDACAVDISIYDNFKELLDYAEPVSLLLNEMAILTNSTDKLKDDLVDEIRFYCQQKAVKVI